MRVAIDRVAMIVRAMRASTVAFSIQTQFRECGDHIAMRYTISTRSKKTNSVVTSLGSRYHYLTVQVHLRMCAVLTKVQ